MFVRQRVQASRKTTQPVAINVRQGQVQQHPFRPRAHCGNIGQVDCQCAIADIKRIGGGREMPIRERSVRHHDQRLRCIRLQQRAVIADTQQYMRRPLGCREKFADKLEFASHAAGL